MPRSKKMAATAETTGQCINGEEYSEALRTCVAPDDIEQIFVILSGIASRWELFAGQLGVESDRVKLIDKGIPPSDNHCIECLKAALRFWIKNNAAPMYQVLIDALKSPIINDNVKAVEVLDNVEKKLKEQKEAALSIFREEMTTDELCVWLKKEGIENEDCEKFKDKKVSGKVFSKMKPEHLGRLGVSFASEVVLGDILAKVKGQKTVSGVSSTETQLQDQNISPQPSSRVLSSVIDSNPIWSETPSLGNLQLLKWVDENGKKRELRIFKEAASSWEDIGSHLELSSAELETIDKDNRGDQNRCLRAIFTKWLTNGSRLPNATLYPVNWKGLYQLLVDSQLEDTTAKYLASAVTVLDTTAKSRPPTVARQTSFPPQDCVVLNVNKHLRHVRNALLDAAYQWRDIGLALGIPRGTILSIRGEDNNCLIEMLTKWMHRGNATMEQLFEALEDESVERQDIVDKILSFEGEKRTRVGLVL